MTIVAVSNAGGTANASTIGDYGNGTSSGLLGLSVYHDENGTYVYDALAALGLNNGGAAISSDVLNTYAYALNNGATAASVAALITADWSGATAQQIQDAITGAMADDANYASRKCGIAGTGTSGIDPWCFAAAGAPTEMAAAAAAGSVANLASAFNYMGTNQLFLLLALTADGYLLGTGPNGQDFRGNQAALETYLKGMYALPIEYTADIANGRMYWLQAFAEVYGYGLINLERATTPSHNINYFNGYQIVSGNGNSYWRAAADTSFSLSSAFGGRAATIGASFYDILESSDGEITLPRVFENEFSMGLGRGRGLYLGDAISEFDVGGDENVFAAANGFSFSMKFSDSNQPTNINGLSKMRFGFAKDNWEMSAAYQHRFADRNNVVLRGDASNPIFGLASNVVESSAKYKFGNLTLSGRAMSGSITDDGLLESDPTISSQFVAANLGGVSGAESGAEYKFGKLKFGAAAGAMNEEKTLLGAYTGGLLALGGGDTVYIDSTASFKISDSANIWGRATFARTTANPSGEFIMGMSAIDSDAFAIGADIKNFSFMLSRPLAARSGVMTYAYADYDVIENESGGYELVADTGIRDLNLRPDNRETRFSFAYRAELGDMTDGALGFVYRVNPDNTKEFGNESIFMMKLRHRVGI
jgi:hypothetical protein